VTAEAAATRRPHAPQAAERRRELATYWAYRGAERAVSVVPRRWLLAAAGAVGNGAFDLAGGRREIIEANVAQALRLPATDPRVQRAGRRAFRNYARYLADMLRLPSLSDAQIDALVTLGDLGELRAAQADGHGVLLCTVHVGAMDLLAPALHDQGMDVHVVAEDTAYGRLYDHLKELRARHGATLIGWRNLRALIRALRAGETLVLFCDGGYRRGDVPVEFLGEATTFPPGPALLAARSGAPIFPVGARRTADDRIESDGLPLIRVASAEPAEVYRATQALADALGGVIAADPGQWYMFRPVWPRTKGDRAAARRALKAARAGDDWTRR